MLQRMKQTSLLLRQSLKGSLSLSYSLLSSYARKRSSALELVVAEKLDDRTRAMAICLDVL